jgi:ribosomal protein S18 acetylase RimI-like enzyme
MGARCLWLETQNINYPAVRFYLHLGFQWCGLDRSLYEPGDPAASETALFFAYELDRSAGMTR